MTELTVNGEPARLDLDPATPLLWALRDALGLKGTKYGCGVGVCGACVVLIDGAPTPACRVPLKQAAGRALTTVEGLAPGHPVAAAWIAEQVPQCGYCQPAQILAATALLARHPAPGDAEIDAAMAGILCRCGTYVRIRRAIHRAAAGGAVAATTAPRPLSCGDQFMLNDFVRVGADGVVTVVVNHSEMGQGALTGLVALVAEEMEQDPARLAFEFAPADRRYHNALWPVQLTGGSSSIRGEWQRFRRAGAQARAMLLSAAAKRWKVRAADCRIGDGRVVHPPTARVAGFGELARAAAREPAPERVPLVSAGDFRCIGRPVPRIDIPDMVAGKTVYGIDFALPGMAVASVERCPYIGGRLQRFDAAEALRVPGVCRVLEIASGVAVVADGAHAAFQGRAALRAEWLPAKGAAIDSAAIEAALDAALEQTGKVAKTRGHARRTLAEGTAVIEAEYCTPMLAHATLEPMNCVAHVTGDECRVWVGTQSQTDTQKAAARASGLPRSRVYVHTLFLGGGFGRRLEADFVEDAVALSRALAQPVQVIWNRGDDLQHDAYRPPGKVRLQACLDERGFPAAWLAKLAGCELALDMFDVPYAIANLRQEHVVVDPPVRVGNWRGVGATQNAFVVESFIDELAHAGGHDPLRYRHALLDGTPRLRALLERVATMAGWDAPLPPGHGRGVAAYACFGSFVAQVAEVGPDAAGALRVKRIWCALDCGVAVNPDAVRAQIEGGIAQGLSAALKEAVRIEGGQVRHATFEDYPILTLPETPAIEVHIADSRERPGGVGEPPVTAVAPAVANAAFAASGVRYRRLPLRHLAG
ncbi:MAG: molybdopterin cofactor-binding domain-containing protein [Pseudomonadota bacterium]